MQRQCSSLLLVAVALLLSHQLPLTGAQSLQACVSSLRSRWSDLAACASNESAVWQPALQCRADVHIINATTVQLVQQYRGYAQLYARLQPSCCGAAVGAGSGDVSADVATAADVAAVDVDTGSCARHNYTWPTSEPPGMPAPVLLDALPTGSEDSDVTALWRGTPLEATVVNENQLAQLSTVEGCEQLTATINAEYAACQTSPNASTLMLNRCEAVSSVIEQRAAVANSSLQGIRSDYDAIASWCCPQLADDSDAEQAAGCDNSSGHALRTPLWTLFLMLMMLMMMVATGLVVVTPT
jgi:hypothetical protein